MKKAIALMAVMMVLGMIGCRRSEQTSVSEGVSSNYSAETSCISPKNFKDEFGCFYRICKYRMEASSVLQSPPVARFCWASSACGNATTAFSVPCSEFDLAVQIMNAKKASR